MSNLQQSLATFTQHYSKRFTDIDSENLDKGLGTKFEFKLDSHSLKDGNHPRILHHGDRTDAVIVLTHGLSDSPYYVLAIAQKFFQLGCNVVLPLMPGHGLKNPTDAISDYDLDQKWKEAIDNAIEVAAG